MNIKINWRNKYHLLTILILGILLRMFFIIKVPCEPVSDFLKYQSIATNIFMGKGHSYLRQPIAFQAMGYPVILGYFYKIVGSNNIFIGKILNVLMSSLTLVLFLFIMKKLTNNKTIIYLSYIMVTFMPNYIAYNNVLGSEILTVFLLTIIIYLQLCTFNSTLRYIIIGFFIGIATLTKPFFLVYPLIVAIIEWLKNKSIKETMKLFFTSFIVVCIVIGPWTYRNYKKFNLFIPVSYNGGYVLFINNNSNNWNGAWMPIANIDVSEEMKVKFKELGFNYGALPEDEVNQVMLNPNLNKIFKKEATKWILNNPQRFCELGIIRLHNTFFSGAGDIYEWAMHSDYKTEFFNIINKDSFHFIFDKNIYILSFAGIIYILFNIKNIIISLFKKSCKVSYITSIPFFNIIFFIMICFVFEGQPRYNFPILFLLTICTSSYLEIILNKVYTNVIGNNFKNQNDNFKGMGA